MTESTVKKLSQEEMEKRLGSVTAFFGRKQMPSSKVQSVKKPKK